MLRYAIDFRFRRYQPDLSLEPLGTWSLPLPPLAVSYNQNGSARHGGRDVFKLTQH